MSKISKKILIAEDSYEWQKFHSALLKQYYKANLDFTITDCAKDALNLVEKNLETTYDLILTDLQMETDFHPQAAGEWLVQKIKGYRQYAQIPIVIISASYNIGFIARSCGVDYLSKRSLINNPDSYFLMLDEKLL